MWETRAAYLDVKTVTVSSKLVVFSLLFTRHEMDAVVGPRAVDLTFDHKPNSDVEHRRILAAGTP